MVAVTDHREPTSLQASPKLLGAKGTVTRYRCGFPNCNKRYASTDGVRKHARKTHMSWLKAIDESAGGRDRQLESKPSTYCVMEVTDDTDDFDLNDESPALMPAPVPTIPSMNQLRAACAEQLPPMPEGSLLGGSLFGGGRDGISDAMAAAAAASLAGAPQQLPLAWLLSNHGMGSHGMGNHGMGNHGMGNHGMGMMGRAPPPATTQAVSQSLSQSLSQSVRSDLPVAMASAPFRMQLPVQLWTEALGAALAAAPSSALPPMPSHGSWTPELMSLLAGSMSGSSDDLTRLSMEGHSGASMDGRSSAAAGRTSPRTEDPLGLGAPPGLGSYTTPPISSTAEKACVSPFELEKRPKMMEAWPSEVSMEVSMSSRVMESKAYTTLDDDDGFNLFDDGQPFMKEAEYTEFLETLLAL